MAPKGLLRMRLWVCLLAYSSAVFVLLRLALSLAFVHHSLSSPLLVSEANKWTKKKGFHSTTTDNWNGENVRAIWKSVILVCRIIKYITVPDAWVFYLINQKRKVTAVLIIFLPSNCLAPTHNSPLRQIEQTNYSYLKCLSRVSYALLSFW